VIPTKFLGEELPELVAPQIGGDFSHRQPRGRASPSSRRYVVRLIRPA
jgi:hypothetical protein